MHESREKCTGELAYRRHEWDSIPKNLITPSFPFLAQVFRPMRSRPHQEVWGARDGEVQSTLS